MNIKRMQITLCPKLKNSWAAEQEGFAVILVVMTDNVRVLCTVNITGTGGLQLFVSKDGTAVLGSTTRGSAQPTPPVSYVSNTVVPNS